MNQAHNLDPSQKLHPSWTSLPSWRLLTLRGVVALLFGVLALVWPGITLLVLLGLFAAYALLAGVAALAAGLKRRGSDGWWLTVLLGLISIAAGVLALVYPGPTLLALVLLMGVNAVVVGVLDIATAIRLRKVIEGEWLLALTGLVSIVFGAVVIAMPLAGVLALVWLVSIYATVTGVLLLALAWRTRRWLAGRVPTTQAKMADGSASS